jgi:50S ribosomal subunit-associated GTPase HflX
VLQQIGSVEKILSDLRLNDIPRIAILNKADLVKADLIEALCRQVTLDKGLECVAISAIQPSSLRTLVIRVAEKIGKYDLAGSYDS